MKKTVSIIVICGLLLSMGAVSVFALPDGCINSVNNNIVLYGSGSTSLSASLNCTAMKPYIVNPDFEVDRYSSGSSQNTQEFYSFDVCQQFIFSIRLVNKSGQDLKISAANPLITVNTSSYVTNHSTPSQCGVSLELLQGNLFNTVYPSTTSAIQGRWNSDYVYNGLLIIPDGFTLWSNFVINYYWTENHSVNTYTSIPNPTEYCFKVDNVLLTRPVSSDTSIMNDFYSIPGVEYNLYQVNQDLDLIYSNLINIYNKTSSIESHVDTIDSNVQAILDAYTSNSSNIASVDDNASNLTSNVDTVHDSESQWFAQNSQALQASGISNYTIPSAGVQGMSTAGTLFTGLWNALGTWNIVYIFSMTMILAVLIIRHSPQRRKGSGGKKNVSSS